MSFYQPGIYLGEVPGQGPLLISLFWNVVFWGSLVTLFVVVCFKIAQHRIRDVSWPSVFSGAHILGRKGALF